MAKQAYEKMFNMLIIRKMQNQNEISLHTHQDGYYPQQKQKQHKTKNDKC